MELHLGLHVPASGARADVVLRARDGASLADVAGALRETAGAGGRLTVDGVEVGDEVLLGAAPLVQGALLEVGAPPPAVTAPWELRVVGGPHAGQAHPLLPGRPLVVGRAGDVRLDDPAVSRRHCRVSADHDGVVVTDLGSANGTSVDGVEVGPDDAPLAEGSVVAVGSSRLAVVETTSPAAVLVPTGDGRLAVNVPPRLPRERPVVQVVVPAPLPEAERRPLPVLAVVAPLVLGVVMWRLTGSTTFLLFTLLSPVLVVGAFWTERRTGRRRSRRDRAVWTAQRQVAEQVLAGAVAADEHERREACPDLAALLATALTRGPRLWERPRGALRVRLGLADQPARVEADGDLAGLRTTARDVPVVVDLAETGVLGLAGGDARALARAVVVQAAVLHSPRDLSVVVLAEPAAAAAWGWARWLPHTAPDGGQDCAALLGLGPAQAARRVAELLQLVEHRADERPEQPQRPVLVVVDGARALRGVAGLARLLADGPAHGVVAVCVEREAAALPAEGRATAVVGPGAALGLRDGGRAELHGTADLLAADLAERAARALAPLRDDTRERGGADALPAQVRWTDAVGLPLGEGDDAAAVLQRWAGAGRSTSAVLGCGADGPLVVDLVRDGPHALVAGTTGSGKSELLQTLIASLALGNRPDELVLVLVDYKGGAAFGPCEHLPHVVGLVTDLDGGLVERALASLTAELSRREAVLRAAGAKDVDDHRRTARPGDVLPRLVLVVDEFASLAEELPEFVGGLVGIAMRGRSLGVHLVLATQRPEGVVSADIRANTNLRVCLAVTRDAESRDVLDSPVAASISRATPGRGWVRTGHADLAAFQAARVGGRRPAAAAVAPGPTVVVRPAAELGDPLPRPAGGEGDDDTTDLALLVTACRDAADRLALPPSRSPWLPPLPAAVVLDDVQLDELEAPGRLAYGLIDVPSEQARRPLALDLDRDTHLLVLGAARSGRTTVLRALAGALARDTAPDDVHLYAVDGGGGLAPLVRLPHTGAVVGLAQPERVDRLLRWLAAETARRQALLAAEGHSSLTEQRAEAAPADRLPHLLLLIDRWEAFVAAFQDVDAGRLLDLVHGLLREGPAAGLHVVLTADRSGLVGRTASLVPDRLLLRMADPADYAAAGLPSRLVPGELPPGRGWWLGATPLAVQVALLDPDPAGPAQAAALTRLADRVAPPARPPRRVELLPAVVRRRDLDAPAGGVLLGVGGDELLPVGVDLDGGLLVGGPAGSGRSTALLALAAGVRGRRLVAVAPRDSPLRAIPRCVTDAGDVAGLAAQVAGGDAVVLVDDAELLVDGPLGPSLEELVRHGRDRATAVVAAGTTADLLTGYRGFAVDLRRARAGLLLCPEPADGDLLGVRLSRTTGGPDPVPGRGLLVRRGQVLGVQVALPDV